MAAKKKKQIIKPKNANNIRINYLGIEAIVLSFNCFRKKQRAHCAVLLVCYFVCRTQKLRHKSRNQINARQQQQAQIRLIFESFFVFACTHTTHIRRRIHRSIRNFLSILITFN